MRERQRPHRWHLTVTVANVHREVLDLFALHFGGRVYRKAKESNPRWRPCWFWAIESRAAHIFVESISPFVRLKRLQVEIVKEFRATIGTGRKNSILRTTAQPRREELRERLTAANHRGLEVN